MTADQAKLAAVPEDHDAEDRDEASNVDDAADAPADDEQPLSRRMMDALHQVDVAAGKQAGRMWREARDPETAPPTWYRVALATLIVAACVTVIFPVLGVILSSLTISTADALRASNVAQAVARSVQRSFQVASQPLGLSPEFLWQAWTLSGLALLVVALSGTRGGKVGWTIFSAATLLVAVNGAPPESRIVLGCVISTIWALLAIVIFRPSKQKREGRPAQRFSGAKVAPRRKTPREVAEEQVAELGFEDLSDYFDKHGNRPLSEIKEELHVRERDARELRLEIAGIERGGGLSPADKRAAVEEARSGVDPRSVAKKYGTTVKTLRMLITEQARKAADQPDNVVR